MTKTSCHEFILYVGHETTDGREELAFRLTRVKWSEVELGLLIQHVLSLFPGQNYANICLPII